MGKFSHPSVVYEDRDEGLVGSLAIYIGALAAVALLVGTPVYLLTMPQQTENHGMAAYEAPRGTRLLPDLNRSSVAQIVSQDLSIAARIGAAPTARR